MLFLCLEYSTNTCHDNLLDAGKSAGSAMRFTRYRPADNAAQSHWDGLVKPEIFGTYANRIRRLQLTTIRNLNQLTSSKILYMPNFFLQASRCWAAEEEIKQTFHRPGHKLAVLGTKSKVIWQKTSCHPLRHHYI